jgi:hypothetical protein
MPPQALDFRGSSVVATLAMVRNAFGHPEHPGNSKRKNPCMNLRLFRLATLPQIDKQKVLPGWPVP